MIATVPRTGPLEFKPKIIQHFPYLTPYHHQKGLQYNSNELELKEFQDSDSFWGVQREAQCQEADKNKDNRWIWNLWHLTASANIKHSPTPKQSNINSNTKAYLSITSDTTWLAFCNILQVMLKCRKKQPEEIKQSLKPHSDIRKRLKLSDRECKITMINMLRAVMIMVDNILEQMGNVSRDLGTLIKNQKEMLGIKNTNRNEECLWCAHQ